MIEKITEVINTLNTDNITEERKQILQPVIEYLKEKIKGKTPIRLNFICTHNSRRSHLSQVWAQTMAAQYGVKKISCYSGGTEATAMFPKVGETLVNQGFQISNLSEGDNPVYAIKFDDNEPAIVAFSKTFDHAFNPKSAFAAIMTCSSADEACPMVSGCDKRFAIMYEDPKKSDGTPEQTETYFNRSLEIATEMKYIFSSL
ncbi:protein-tyrosine-phosphatase [Tamlana fucoidanivorans]|uniref:Protein-tyrosine-phosphatase n=1 Tax=Allotamlana fucoidanivorans TaxID=2583814 RepID=A0A5C4SK17_9FLAO|nr:protein-tyrosine-phosphatase [Tamlana fucoidanivorans]TNJ44149.1 protein-tyrosine-phosphatase [Tamlana fucoidanivorans]